ncbi:MULTISPECIES: amino acid ABC transporter ATP-binding protein [Nguyenibacter]|uniref:Amino acid ABC transporter ATP-binding protein n=1 Tax=Nguyenibacter vanlangensis TaxID=1216886 RepID=A0A7Y7IW62_9PROT|nr:MULTISPECIES: amino acid ABC transporter ATP-binding protein [Nguyenibacter]NVN11449.1 amino acid ABC transporter ATP-binding protein [Nguyenibacter vanlangensis]WRH86464.1 amino acid ABC transporter ATP-binding protein [Nguyenibacter sp. L1]
MVVQADQVRKIFDGHPILRGISLTVARGELVSIIGPSGCGKSTFLRCLNFLEVPDSGTVSMAGVTIARAGGRWSRADEESAHRLRAHVGMVFQSFNLFPHRTVLDNVMMAPIRVKRLGVAEARQDALALLEKVGLSAIAARYPDTLSGGQQQRAAIARALAMRPDVMLYDEPTSALDPELAEEVLSVMRTLDAEGMTQIVVTHDMRFARAASDRVVFMEGGEIVEMDDPDTLFVAPQDMRTRRFLRSVL